MNALQTNIWDVLTSMSGEDVARALTDYHGNQLLDEGFAEFLVDDGYCDAADLGLDEDEEDEEELPDDYYPNWLVIDDDGDEETLYTETAAKSWHKQFGGRLFFIESENSAPVELKL